MATDIFVGSVAVGVVPDARGWNDKLRAELVPSSSTIGDQVGQGISKGVTDSLGSPSTKTKMSKSGTDSADAFGTGFTKRIKAALDALPNVKLDANSSAADKKIAELRKRMEAMLGKEIGVDLSAKEAMKNIGFIDTGLEEVRKKSKDIKITFDTKEARAQLALLRKDAGTEGGGGIVSKIGGLFSGAGAAAPAAGGAASSGASGAGPLASIAGAVTGGPGIIAGITAAILALPFIAQAAAGAVVAALGGALAGIGIAGAIMSGKLKDQWAGFTADAKKNLISIGASFVPVLAHILSTAKQVMDQLTPLFASVVKTIAGPFKVFVDTILKGFNDPAVKQSIKDVANAFVAILRAFTPDIPGIFRSVAQSISAIAQAVARNPKAFADFLNFMFQIVIAALRVIWALTIVAIYIEQHFGPAMHRVAVVFDGVRHDIAHIWDQIFENSVGMMIRLAHNIETQFNSLRNGIARAFDNVRHDVATAMNNLYGATIGVAIRIGHDVETQFNSLRHETAVIFDGIRHDIAHTWDQIYSNTIGAVIRVWQKTGTGFANMRHDIAGHMDDIRHDIAHYWDLIYQDTIGRVIRLGHDVEAQINNQRHNISAIFAGMRHDISVIYDNIRHDVAHYWDLIYQDTLGRVIRIAHDVEAQIDNMRHSISSKYDGIRHDISSAWDTIWNNTISRVQRGWNDLAGVFSRGWNNVWQHTVVPMMNVFRNDIPNAFRDAVNTLGRFWSGLYDAVRKPVVNVVDHVLNALIDAFNSITHFIGVGAHINNVHPQGLAAGGRITRGSGPTSDDVIVRVSKGETVVSAEHSGILAETFAALGIPGYANGGKVGQNPPGTPPGGAVGRGGVLGAGAPTGPALGPLTGPIHKAIDAGKMATAFATGNAAAFTNAFADLLGQAPGAGTGALAQILIKIPQTIAKAFVDWIMAKSAAAMASGSGSDIANYAESFLHKIPYVWGGTAVPGGADCSGFTQGVYGHFGIRAPRTSEAQGAWVKRGPPVSGGLAFYHSPAGGADPGHVAVVKNAGMVISQGGGMGPTLMALHGMPLLWTGTPPGGFGGNVGAGSAGVGDLIANASAIGPYLMAHGATKIAAAGIMGNMLQESGGNWNAPGGGLIQIIAGPQPRSLAESLSQTITYINQNGGFGAVNAAGDVASATRVFMDLYERPAVATENLQRRLAGANAAWAAGYDEGGWLPPGASVAYNGTGRPERVLSHAQLARIQGGSGPEYHAHFDGLTGAAIESHVHTAFQAMSMTSGRLNRQGRRS